MHNIRQFGAYAQASVSTLRGKLANFYYTDLFGSSAWAAVGDSVSRGLFLVAFILCSRLMPSYDYGQLSLIRTTILTFVTFAGLGMGMTANRYIAEHLVADKWFVGLLIGGSNFAAAVLGTIVAIGIWGFAPYIGAGWLKDPLIVDYLRWCAPIVLLASILGTQIGVMQGFGAYRQLAAVGSIQGVVAILALPTGAALAGIDGAILGILTYNLVGVILLSVTIRKHLRIHGVVVRLQPLGQLVPILLKFSLPAALGGLAIAPFKWFAEVQLARSGGFDELAVFGAAMLLTSLLLSLVSTMNAPLITYFTRKAAQPGDDRSHLNLFGTWYAFLLIAIPLLVWPSLGALPFDASYRTDKFQVVMLGLLTYVGLMLFHAGIVRLMILRGNLWLTVSTTLVEGAVLIAGAIALSDQGAVGLVIAYVFSYVVRIPVSLVSLHRAGGFASALLADRMFLLTVAAFVSMLAFQLWRLS